MPRRASKNPTELELAILKVIWRRGPSTGREVRDTLGTAGPHGKRDLAYTSVMTVMNIMVEKGYLRRQKVSPSGAAGSLAAQAGAAEDTDTPGQAATPSAGHAASGYVYAASIDEALTSRRMLGDLVHRLFGGSAAAAALSLLRTSDLDATELKELRRLVNEKLKDKDGAP